MVKGSKKTKATKKVLKGASRAKNGNKNKKPLNHSYTSTSELDYTLPPDNFLDSFDKFVADGKRNPKQKITLKKDFHESLNQSEESNCYYYSDSSDSHTDDETEKEAENAHPNRNDSSIQYGRSINSSNSFMFPDSKRQKRRAEKALNGDKPNKNEPVVKARRKGRTLPNLISPPISPQSQTDGANWLRRNAIALAEHTSTPSCLIHKVELIEDISHIHCSGQKSLFIPNGSGSLTHDASYNAELNISKSANSRSFRDQPNIQWNEASLFANSNLGLIEEEEGDENKGEESVAIATSTSANDDVPSILPNETEDTFEKSGLTLNSSAEHSHSKTDSKDICNESKDSSAAVNDTCDNEKQIVDLTKSTRETDINSNENSNGETEEITKSPTLEPHASENPIDADVGPMAERKSKKQERPRVGFNVVDSIHEFQVPSKVLVPIQNIHIKGGKWRRTVFELRKSRTVESPKRKTFDANSDGTTWEKSRFSIRRKSINIKNILERNSVNRESIHRSIVKEARKSLNKIVVLDESDVESFSSDFSPKPTPINALSKQRSVDRVQQFRRQSIFDRTHKNSLNSCSSASVESVVDELTTNLEASLTLDYDQHELKAQLLKRCGQDEILPFDEVYSARILKKCKKIGEGVFGEVFLNEPTARSSYVLKIIPIEGIEEINGALQKQFDEILQEVIISQELSALRYDEKNCTAGYVEVLNVHLVEGRYPAHLNQLWEEFKERHGTENEDPAVFTDEQLYVVFELADCGIDLEAHVFKNAEQAYSAYKQVALSLAVAETKLQFEHRDLHWGNVLIKPTIEKSLTFNINGKSISVPTHGIKATIIDYTLSRIIYKDCCLFQDLAADPELFEASGDYQFDVYRLMQTQTNNCWETFEPFTNVLWLHYLIDKMIDGARYSAKKTAVKHRKVIGDMMKLRDELLDYKCATDFFENHLIK